MAFMGSWSWAVGYLATFALLGAVCLGAGFSALIREYGTGSIPGAAVVCFLVGCFLLGPSLSRPADLPVAVYGAGVPTRALDRLAEALRTHIPPGSHVFHLGSFQPLYIAGLQPYLRQVFGAWTLSPVTDERIRRKSGLWGETEIREWMENSQYAVIVPTDVGTYRAACARCVELVESLLAKQFREIAVLGHYPGRAHVVYRRSDRTVSSGERK